jgi:hypothetical protein
MWGRASSPPLDVFNRIDKYIAFLRANFDLDDTQT